MWTVLGVVAIVAVVALVWRFGHCSHRYATLQPPVRDGGPERDHARWYCDRCGRTWDAGLEPTTRPRMIYSGYDENKAVHAAARAEALDKQRRRIATKRTGGTRPRAVPAVPVQRPGPRPIESMLEPRAARRG